ncbi:MAG: helix-turn-helix domain-containing protein, partial [Saprospiraceae bacterium]
NENLDVALIQQSTGMSRPQLYRKLKGLTGLSPGAFRKQIRMKTAYTLLLEKQLSVKEVAFEVGYKYPSHFSKDFKTLFGVSPKEI